ncbi:DNA cytosine methyltransferase, partial [Phascolarctobacterium sp.]
AADYGVTQSRKRLIILAALVEQPILPLPTHGTQKTPYSTVGEWINNLPVINAGETSITDPDHCSTNLSELNLKRIKCTPPGGSRENWPDNLKLNCHKNHSGHTDVYGRLDYNKMAATLTTKCISYSNGRYGHPEQNRALSIREAACLQTFPRDFFFTGNLVQKARQVGNAVPPLLAQRIGETFKQIDIKHF